ncbi:MAG: hypothetical protein JJV99_12995 [Colwellia sp.]|nr:hypothetical protein [Colwellia sp.]
MKIATIKITYLKEEFNSKVLGFTLLNRKVNIDKVNFFNNNYPNITATLSTTSLFIKNSYAQPWRFFFACRKVTGIYRG